MNIYTSEQIHPYVYVGINPNTNDFYIGARFGKNIKMPSHLDLKIYKTSSKKIKTIGFENFIWIIVAEFPFGEWKSRAMDAFLYEQGLIREWWGNKNLLNGNYITKDNKTIHNSFSRLPHNTNAFGLTENLIKTTGDVLNVSHLTPKKPNEFRKYAAFNNFRIRFDTEIERQDFLYYNKHFSSGDPLNCNEKSKILISSKLTGKKKPPRSQQHTNNLKNAYPKTNKNKGVPKSDEHKNKLRLINLGRKPSAETLLKKKNSSYKNGIYVTSKIMTFDIMLAVDMIVLFELSKKDTCAKLHISEHLLSKRLQYEQIDLSKFIKRNQSSFLSRNNYKFKMNQNNVCRV
jgi:hypothetical protein